MPLYPSPHTVQSLLRICTAMGGMPSFAARAKNLTPSCGLILYPLHSVRWLYTFGVASFRWNPSHPFLSRGKGISDPTARIWNPIMQQRLQFQLSFLFQFTRPAWQWICGNETRELVAEPIHHLLPKHPGTDTENRFHSTQIRPWDALIQAGLCGESAGLAFAIVNGLMGNYLMFPGKLFESAFFRGVPVNQPVMIPVDSPHSPRIAAAFPLLRCTLVSPLSSLGIFPCLHHSIGKGQKQAVFGLLVI